MIYLLHFSRPYIGARRNPNAKRVQSVQHYLGWTPGDVNERVELHRKGQGSRLCAVVTNAGIALELVRTWQGSRTDERKLKNRKNAAQLCPICKARQAK